MSPTLDPDLYDPNQQNPYLLQPPQPANGPYGYNPYPYGGFDPNANNGLGNGVDTSQATGFTPTGNEAVVDPNAPMENIFASNRDTINTTGNTIGQEAGNSLNYYGGQQTKYDAATDNALNQLNQTPGYNSTQAQAIAGDPNAPVNTVNAGVEREQGLTDEYGRNLSGQLEQADSWMGQAADRYGSGVRGAASGLGTGLAGAQGKFGALDTAVNNPALGFDPNFTEKQMTDADVNDLVTSAGTTVGNQFRTAEDTLERQALAQGNTSPAAQAALRQNLITQEGATAGDAMTNARIAALQAQYGRAAGIEAQREGAVDTQTGLKATAATTEEAAAQAAAGLAGTAGIASEEAVGANTQAVANRAGQLGLDTANTYGQFNVGQQNTQTGQQYGAGLNADQLASGRAKSIADQAIAGQGAYRAGVAGQGAKAQQGSQTAVNQQLGAYGTQTSGGNASASGQAGFEVSKASIGDKLGSSLATLFADGGIASADGQIAKVGERGPEWVGNVNALQREGMRGARYGSSRRRREDPELKMAA